MGISIGQDLQKWGKSGNKRLRGHEGVTQPATVSDYCHSHSLDRARERGWPSGCTRANLGGMVDDIRGEDVAMRRAEVIISQAARPDGNPQPKPRWPPVTLPVTTYRTPTSRAICFTSTDLPSIGKTGVTGDDE